MEEVRELLVSDLVKKFRSIIDLLRYHAAAGRFSYIDRMNAAMDPKVVEETIREAQRTVVGVEPQARRGKKVSFEDGRPKFEEEVEITCCEEEELRREDVLKGRIPGRIWLHGTVLEVAESGEAKYIACLTPPKIPSETEVAEFLDAVEKDISIARRVACLALFGRERRGGEER